MAPTSPMIHGHYHVGRWLVAYRNRYCTTCHSEVLADARRSILVLHLYWIPILPIGTTVRYFCRECGQETDKCRPSRPSILIAGAAFAVFMTVIGATMLKDPELRPAGLGAVAIGPLLAVALITVLRRQTYAAYAQAVKAVTPLEGRTCPVCQGMLLQGTPPRCFACKADILTH